MVLSSAVPPARTALSTTACTRVVSGLTVVEPAGAFSAIVLATPVSMLTPPTAMMVPLGASVGMKKSPVSLVRPMKKSVASSATPLLLVSMKTFAPRT